MLPNPFTADIFPDGWPTSAEDSLVHLIEWEQLLALIEGQERHVGETLREGRVVLLKAPRAGYGKSHLLAALMQKVSAGTAVIAPVWESEHEFRWTPLLWSVVERYHQTEIGQGSLTQLDRLARQLFGLLNAELIRNKKVPCANPEAAISALQQRSLELFDLQDARQAVGKWFVEHFERLLPVNSALLAQRTGLSQEAAVTWLRALCGYTQEAADNAAVRYEQFRWALQQSDGTGRMAGGMQILTAPTLDEHYSQDRLVEFLRLASQVHPVVMVFDHLDAVHGQPAQTMRVAALIADFRRLLPQSLIILSANQDLWAGSFQKYLPSALEDRLSEAQIDLKELTIDQALHLLRARLRVAGVSEAESHAFLTSLTQRGLLENGQVSAARALLRHASRAWNEWSRPPLPVGVERLQNADEAEESLPNFGELLPGTVGTSTSFQQLKLMLEKLRLDRVASGKLPTAIPVQQPLASIAVQEHREEITAQFRQLRQRLLSAKPLRIDQDLLCHLLGACGKRLAVVRASHLPLPGSSGPGVMLWQTPDAEILFGTEAHEDRTYWHALLGHARQRHASQSFPRTHVAIFSASQEPVNLQWWLGTEESAVATQSYVDLISLDPEALATLYAADELLHTAEHSGDDGNSPDEVFAALAQHIEPFWKRLTRVRPPHTEAAANPAGQTQS